MYVCCACVCACVWYVWIVCCVCSARYGDFVYYVVRVVLLQRCVAYCIVLCALRVVYVVCALYVVCVCL